MYRQLKIMKDMGANAIRITHNPGDKDFIEICNKLGLLVIEELFDGWVDPKNENSYDFSSYFTKTLGDDSLLGSSSDMTWAEFAARSVVRRDRNDPSIILWSLCNEVRRYLLEQCRLLRRHRPEYDQLDQRGRRYKTDHQR